MRPPSESVVLVSNRGPLKYRSEGAGRVAERGAGGLVTALPQLTGHLDEATWVCAALSEEDAAVADQTEPAVAVMTLQFEITGHERDLAVVFDPDGGTGEMVAVWAVDDDPSRTTRSRPR